MLNEMDAPVDRSPNPVFTELLQEQNAEHTARLMFGQLEVGAALWPDLELAAAVAGRPVEVVEAIVHDPAPGGHPERFPFRASLGRMHNQRPVVVSGLVSATPTGSINLRLRKQIDQ